MKSLLDRFRKQPKPQPEEGGFTFNPNPAPAAAAAEKSARGLTVRRLILPAVIVSLAVVLIAGAVNYLQFTLLGQQAHDAVTQGRTQRIAALFAGRLQGYADVMAASVRQPALIQALAANDRSAMEQHAANLRNQLPDVLRVRLLPAGEKQVDESTTPTLSYACLELANLAETGQSTPVETHLFGTKDQHIDLIQAVDSDKGVVGSLLVSLDVNVLKRWMQAALPADGGYAELRQGDGGRHLMLAAAGDAGMQNRPGAHSEAVAGSSWTLVYWPPASLPAVSMAQQSAFFTVYGVAVVVLIVTFVLLTALASRIVKNDLVAVVKQGLEMWGGQRQHTFEVKLAESLEVLAALEQRIAELQPKPTVKPDAAKAAAMQKEQESGIVVDEPPPADEDLPSSLMFMREDSVQVEELGPGGVENGENENKDK